MGPLYEMLQSRRGCVIILALFTLLAFANTLFHQFIYDDLFTIVNNSFIASLRHLPDLFSREYFEANIELSYRPVVTLSFMLDCFVWGKSPTGFHLTNVVLHLLNAMLVLVLLRRLLGAGLCPLYGALVFALHPVTTEAVNLVSYREDVLATAFLLGALLSYLEARRAGRGWHIWAALSLLCAALAYFSKESAAALLLILCLFEFAPVGKSSSPQENAPERRAAALIASHAAVLAFYLLVRFVLMANPEAGRTAHFAPTLLLEMLNFFRLFAFYFYLLILPVHLCADYRFEAIVLVTHPAILASLTFALCYVIVGLAVRRRVPLIHVSLGWILLTLLPVSNLVPLRNPVAERYLYLPLVGFSLLVASIIKQLLETAQGSRAELSSAEVRENCARSPASSLRAIIAFLCVAQLLAYFALTSWRNTIWGNEEILWTETLKRQPRSATAHNNLGVIYLRRGDLPRARTHLEQAQRLDASDAKVWNNLGALYAQSGESAEALRSFQIAVALNPRMASAHYNLARLYADTNLPDYERAWQHLQVAKRRGYAVPAEFESRLHEFLLSAR